MNPKQLAAQHALKYIRSGTTIGLGTGSTADFLIIALGEALKSGQLYDVRGVPTSVASERRAQELGIPIVPRSSGFHMFRHTAASLINKETGNMKLSQAQLGHANLQITADVYTHVDEGQKRKAAEALERGVLGEL